MAATHIVFQKPNCQNKHTDISMLRLILYHYLRKCDTVKDFTSSAHKIKPHVFMVADLLRVIYSLFRVQKAKMRKHERMTSTLFFAFSSYEHRYAYFHSGNRSHLYILHSYCKYSIL